LRARTSADAIGHCRAQKQVGRVDCAAQLVGLRGNRECTSGKPAQAKKKR